MKKRLLLILFLAILFIPIFTKPVLAEKTSVYLFYGNGCGHCAEEQIFLDLMEEKYDIEVKRMETWYNPENDKLHEKFCEAYGSKKSGVPRTFIGDKSFSGFTNDKGDLLYSSFSESYIGFANVIEGQIKHCAESGCYDPEDILEGREKAGEEEKKYDIKADMETKDEEKVNLPFVGEVDLKKTSLPVLTIIIGLLDGFNPCAMWMLSFLLALLVTTKSRKKMFFVGGIFIGVSGIVYFLFMAAWLNVFLLLGVLAVLRIIVGVFAIGAGLVNMKDFFYWQKWISLTIPASWQSGIKERMKRVVKQTALPATIGGVVLLAFTINLVELMCTVGFPAIYIRVLTLHNLSTLTYYLYLAFYTLLYMFDDLILFTIAVFTLTATPMTRKKVQWMKLIGGVLMITLGILLIFRPELLMFG